MHAVEERQSNIIKRAQIIIQQKVSFFDHAPMAVDKTGTIGATLIFFHHHQLSKLLHLFHQGNEHLLLMV